MNAAVIPIRPAPEPAQKPDLIPTHVTLQPAARHAFTALEGRVGQLRRVFAGASATVSAASEIDRICADAMVELQRIKRWAK